MGGKVIYKQPVIKATSTPASSIAPGSVVIGGNPNTLLYLNANSEISTDANLVFDESVQVFQFLGGNGAGIKLNSVTGESVLGDADSLGNNTNITVNDSTQEITSNTISFSIPVSAIYYFGSENVDGSWRRRIDGVDLVDEKRELGIWVEKNRIVG